MTNYRYELQIHSRDVKDILSTEIARHSGYDLIMYDGDMPVKITSIDLYRDKGKIKFDIREQYISTYVYDNYGYIVGSTVRDGDDLININIHSDWLLDKNYDTDTLVSGNSKYALETFNKIKLEAEILNNFSKYMDYGLLSLNCNASTDYFAYKYLNGMNVFTNLDGVHIGSAMDFRMLIDMHGGNKYIRTTIDNLDKFYELIEGTNFDLNTADPTVTQKNDGYFLSITDGNTNYIFDDENNSAIINSSNNDSVIYLGDGHNVLNTGNGNNIIYGGKDIDSIRTGNGNNTVHLGGGSDSYTGGNGVDIVDGGSIGSIYGSDVSGDTNTINLGGGNDIYFGGEGKDIVHGGIGRDSLSGFGGNDELYGETGDDYLYGGDGNNKLDAGM